MFVLEISKGRYVKAYKRATTDVRQAIKFGYRRNAEIAAKVCTDNPVNIKVRDENNVS